MCYSAQLEMRFPTLKRELGARVDVQAFQQLMAQRLDDPSIKIPKALEVNFVEATTPAEKQVRNLILEYNSRRGRELEAELFRQKTRLADAERSLKLKETKKALESQRIASNKVQWHLDKLADLQRTEPKASDSRIFPFHYAPVIVLEGHERVIKPMRYHCRPAGKPEFYDRKFDGLYNARRDNLEKFWKGQFSHRHAIIVMTGFYENVARHDFEHRELAPGEKPENLVLNFNPNPAISMLAACLWSHWEEASKASLDSFAAITDEPPPEIAAAGHDRCIVPLKNARLVDWLDPERAGIPALYAALDDRVRPYYEHRQAA